MKKQIFLLSIIALFIFGGCASKSEEEFNKPATYWYNKIVQKLATYQLDQADSAFASLESEHKNSSLVANAILILANAHIAEEEYQMANYYLDEYIKKYAENQNIDYIKFLKIKANFMAFKQQFREQQLLGDTLLEIDSFIETYPNSNYIYLVKTIQTKIAMSEQSLNLEIASLYDRKNKPKAVEFYKEKAKQNWVALEDIEPVHVPWYRRIFE